MALACKLRVFVVLSLFTIVSVGSADTASNILCSNDKYSAGASYGDAVSTIIRALADSTASSGYDVSAQSRPSNLGDPVCYGHATCQAGIAKPDCATCILNIGDLLRNRCPMSYGAQAQSQSCRVRYERYPFTGNK